MDYATLLAQHDAIDAAVRVLLACIGPVPKHAECTRLLSVLSLLVDEHLAVEDPIIYETVNRTDGTRHTEAAMVSVFQYQRLTHDWRHYLGSWDEAAVAADWAGFCSASRPMLDRLQERVSCETAVLYALAEHYAVIGEGGECVD